MEYMDQLEANISKCIITVFYCQDFSGLKCVCVWDGCGEASSEDNAVV